MSKEIYLDIIDKLLGTAKAIIESMVVLFVTDSKRVINFIHVKKEGSGSF